jgi:anaerobic selenocysteine-containing dehydrogenase
VGHGPDDRHRQGTITYDDFARSDLIIILGQNPGTNHPRMLTALEEAKEFGAKIVAVNPLPEAGLRRYKNPQRVSGIVGRGTEIADQFLQIRLGGDMALLQAVSKRVFEAEAKNPGTVLIMNSSRSTVRASMSSGSIWPARRAGGARGDGTAHRGDR